MACSSQIRNKCSPVWYHLISESSQECSSELLAYPVSRNFRYEASQEKAPGGDYRLLLPLASFDRTLSLLNGLATASPVLHLVHIWHGFHCLFHLGCTSLNKNFIFSLQLPWFCQPWLLMPTVQAIKRLWKVSIKQILRCALRIPALREAKFGMCRGLSVDALTPINY